MECIINDITYDMFFSTIQGLKFLGHLSDVAGQNLLYLEITVLLCWE
jgi:hypothetical protein